MIFWWSESRLEKFLANFLEQEHIREKIYNLNGKIDSLHNSVNENKRNIQELGKLFNENREETSDAIEKINRSMSSIQNSSSSMQGTFQVDMDELMDVIDKKVNLLSKDYIQYVNKAISENNKVEGDKWHQSLKESEKLLETEVETIVKRYIQSLSSSKKNQSLDKNEIVSELTEIINNIVTQNNAQTNRVLIEYDNELKRLSTEIKKQTNNEFLNTLVKGYEDEKKKNSELSEIVRKQSEGIANLSETIEDLKGQLEKLKEKLDSNDVNISTSSVRKSLFFDEDNNENKCKLLSLLDHAKLLKNKLCEMGIDSADVYLKLVDNLIDKLDKLIVKNSEKQYTADKIANDIVKILRQTIIKGLTQEKVKEEFIQYLDECGIRRIGWNVGRKLSNDDYEYLEEPIMYEDVIDDNKAGTILEIVQDTYIIDYLEDDEKYEAIIPGLYRIGKSIK